MHSNFVVCGGHDTNACDDGGNKITAANDNWHAKYSQRNEAVGVRDGIAARRAKRGMEREVGRSRQQLPEFCWKRPPAWEALGAWLWSLLVNFLQ